MKTRLFLGFLALTLFTGCLDSIDKETLVGKWQGVTIDYADKGQGINASGQSFEFLPDGTYVDSGTERGTYSTKINMLYLEPEGGDRRALEVKRQQDDTLIINLNVGAIPVLLTMVRAE